MESLMYFLWSLWLVLGLFAFLSIKRFKTQVQIVFMDDGPDLEAEDKEIEEKLKTGELESGEPTQENSLVLWRWEDLKRK